MIKTTLNTDLAELLLEDNTIAGIVVPYNQKSQPSILRNGRKVYKVMANGCFGDSLTEVIEGRRNIFCNVEHSYNAKDAIGSTAVNIELEDRADGLYMKMTMPDLTWAKDLYKQIKLGFVKGLSVEYLIPETYEAKYEKDSNGDYIKTIEADSVIIDGFAITSHPRFLGAKLVAMNDDEAIATEKDIEDFENKDTKEPKDEGGVSPELEEAITKIRIDYIENRD